jgi:hypothetical protein
MTRRKVGAMREPNGQTKRSKRQQPDDMMSPTEMRRLIDASKAGLKDPVWGSMVGRLHLAHKLTTSQFNAGVTWSSLARDYSAASQSPREPKSANLNPVGGEPPDPDSPQGLEEAQRHTHARHQYIAGLGIINLAGAPARRAVEATCEKDLLPAGHAQLEALGLGLSALSAFWGKRK